MPEKLKKKVFGTTPVCMETYKRFFERFSAHYLEQSETCASLRRLEKPLKIFHNSLEVTVKKPTIRPKNFVFFDTLAATQTALCCE